MNKIIRIILIITDFIVYCHKSCNEEALEVEINFKFNYFLNKFII